MVTLKVFVEEDCWSCSESRRLIAEMAPQFPQVAMEVVDLSQQQWPPKIFAVPTYTLNGEVISLGNPYPTELRRKLQAALAAM
jgi:hypothetical protein